MLNFVFDDSTMNKVRIYELYKCFEDGRENIIDYESKHQHVYY